MESIASQLLICDELFVARAATYPRRWYVYRRDGGGIISAHMTKGEAAYWAWIYHSAWGC